MTLRLRHSALLTLLILAMGAPAPAVSQNLKTRGSVLADEYVDAPGGGMKALSMPAEPGAPTLRHRVVIRQIIIDPRQRGVLPTSGDTLVELKAGELTTVINNQRQTRAEGEFWSVPSDTEMIVETEDDAAIIETTAIRAVR